MVGLPTETDDDIRGIAELAQKIVDLRTDKVYNGVVNLEACEAVVLKVIE